jgi:hypothetical protein
MKSVSSIDTDKVTFYGHIFSKEGVQADPKKCEAIQQIASPQNVTELRSFLGMAQYVAAFIPNFASLTAPLRKLLHKDVDWEWNEEQDAAITQIKAALGDRTVMGYFDPRKKTSLIVDGSPIGLGAILKQEKVVAYASRSLTDAESRYSQTERELLAIVWAVNHFHLYLFNTSFAVFTDHKPLLGIVNSSKVISTRLERLKLKLQPYKSHLVYIKGKNPENPADALSRNPLSHTCTSEIEEYVNFVTSNAVPKAMNLEEIKEATLSDETLQEVIKRRR